MSGVDRDAQVKEDIGIRAQHAAERHLAACIEAMHEWEENDFGEITEIESPASAPFCGCDTCIVREVLWAAWSIMEEAR